MGVSYLLDTHAFVWLVQADGPAVPTHVAEAVASADQLYVSSVSALEVATKVRIGQLAAAPLVSHWAAARRRIGAQALELSEQEALLAGSLEWDHRDPFDRMLAAQASTRRLTLLTADAALLEAPHVRTLAW